MKSIYSGAKQQLSSCMLHDSNDDPTPTTLLNNNHSNHNHTNNSNNNNCNHYYHNNNNNHHHSSTNNSHNQSITTTTSSDINDDNSSFILAAISANNRTTTTYDTSQSPFKYDKKRGRWSSAADFYFACTSHAFGTVVFSEVPVYALLFGGVYFFPAYLFAILLYGIPIFIIQTFLGQFSTSGAISAFRVAPIFKGIGYSILLLNLTSLTYYGVIAAVPLIYAANSLFTVIPWMSCDNEWNSPNCSTHSTFEYEDEHLHHHSTVEFFHSLIRSADDHKSNFHLSWPLLYTTIAIWIFTTAILLKRVSFIGKFFRCTCLLMLALFLAIFVHLLFYVHLDWDTFAGYFKPALGSTESIGSSFGAAILMASWVLGPGWGNVLTLASHNNFRHDSERLTYWVSATHVVLAIMAMICGRIALDHFEDEVGMFHDHVEEDHYMQFLYLCFAYLFGSFSSLPNFWCFLFFFMLFLAEICAVIIQMMSILSSIFDEFEKLRSRKTVITISLCSVLLLFSVYFCTKKGFEHLHLLPTIVVLSHVIISFILLLMTTWIYGRERFQCDLQFMLGKTISNFKIFLIRFVTPVFLVMSVLQILFFLERDDPPSLLLLLSQSAVVLVAPGYMIHKVCQTTGSLRQRLKQCFAPHDWHPVDADNRRFYEEVMGTSEMLVIDSDGQSHGHNEC